MIPTVGAVLEVDTSVRTEVVVATEVVFTVFKRRPREQLGARCVGRGRKVGSIETTFSFLQSVLISSNVTHQP
jgi:hypothetical protein